MKYPPYSYHFSTAPVIKILKLISGDNGKFKSFWKYSFNAIFHLNLVCLKIQLIDELLIILVLYTSIKSARQCHTNRIESKITSHSSFTSPPSVTSEYKSEFQEKGFTIIPSLIPKETCDILNERLEQVFLGNYSTGNSPDKAPVTKEKDRGVYRQKKP